MVAYATYVCHLGVHHYVSLEYPVRADGCTPVLAHTCIWVYRAGAVTPVCNRVAAHPMYSIGVLDECVAECGGTPHHSGVPLGRLLDVRPRSHPGGTGIPTGVYGAGIWREMVCNARVDRCGGIDPGCFLNRGGGVTSVLADRRCRPSTALFPLKPCLLISILCLSATPVIAAPTCRGEQIRQHGGFEVYR